MPLTPDVGRQLIKEHTLRALVTQLSDGCEVGYHLASPHRTWLVGITTESRAFNSSHLVVSKGVTNSLRLQSAGEQSLASLRDERPINFKQRQRKLVACVLCVHSVSEYQPPQLDGFIGGGDATYDEGFFFGEGRSWSRHQGLLMPNTGF